MFGLEPGLKPLFLGSVRRVDTVFFRLKAVAVNLSHVVLILSRL